MKTKVLLVALIAVVALNVVARNFTPVAASPRLVTADPATANQLLRSTVQIAMYEFATGAGYEAGDRGLGTLVRHGDETLIITHDHWKHLNANLNEVEFRDAQGRLLLTLDAAAYTQMIRHRDGGTTVLSAPADLAAHFVPTALAGAASLASGSQFWTVRRSGAGGTSLEVVGAMLEAVENDSAPARLRLRGAGGAVIVPGDSGGGVWANGRLLGNLWSAGVELRSYFWSRLTGSQEATATNLIFAAVQPLGEVAEMEQPGPVMP